MKDDNQKLYPGELMDEVTAKKYAARRTAKDGVAREIYKNGNYGSPYWFIRRKDTKNAKIK